MPAAPVHHTKIDATTAWDGPAAKKDFDPAKPANFKKFFAWYEPEPESKTDGWGPHHDVASGGTPGDANEKGFQAAMAALNGARGGNSKVPDADRQKVYNHLAAHYADAGTKEEDIPALKRSADLPGEARSAAHESFTGSHSHAHTAHGDQGDDATHEHEHTHDGDAKHSHTHDARSAALPVTTRTLLDANDAAGEIGDGDDDADDAGTVPCPSCMTMNPAALDVCVNCGGDLPPDASVLPADTGPGMDAVIDDDSAGDMDSPPINPSTAFNSRNASDSPAVIRSRIGKGINLRSDDDAPMGSLMFGYFSTFNDPYEIDSMFEGVFLEQVARGAYADTIKNDLAGMRCLFDHGFDPELGNKPLGPITVLREDETGAYYEVPLLDTNYNRNFILPALQGRTIAGQMTGSLLGASMRFIVLTEEWDRSGKVTKTNPKGLPLRTITGAQVLEFGAVTFPANIGATSGVRSGTDDFIDHLHHDQRFVARLTERTGPGVVERMLDTMRWDPGMARNGSTTDKRRADGSSTRSLTQRRALAALHDIEGAAV